MLRAGQHASLLRQSGAGTAGVNYNETDFGYNLLNRQNRIVAPSGTITRTVIDVRNVRQHLDRHER